MTHLIIMWSAITAAAAAGSLAVALAVVRVLRHGHAPASPGVAVIMMWCHRCDDVVFPVPASCGEHHSRCSGCDRCGICDGPYHLGPRPGAPP